MANKKATSGKSNGAAGTVARKTIAQPRGAKASAAASVAGTAKQSAAANIARANTPDRIANRMTSIMARNKR